MVDTANESEASPVVLVLGAKAELLEREVEDKKIHIVVNKDWSEGMASSVVVAFIL
jgi:CTP:molybdopterin cytidylyltransferase MocA